MWQALDELLDTARLSTLRKWCEHASRSGLDAPIFALARSETSRCEVVDTSNRSRTLKLPHANRVFSFEHSAALDVPLTSLRENRTR